MTHDSHVQVWKTPNHLIREFAPFVLHRTYTGHHDDVLSIEWSPDSQCVSTRILTLTPQQLSVLRCFITTSKDMTARLYTLNPVEGFRPKTFAGHKNAVLSAYFSSDSKSVMCYAGFCDLFTDCDSARCTLLVATVLCSSGEPSHPTILPPTMKTNSLLRQPLKIL